MHGMVRLYDLARNHMKKIIVLGLIILVAVMVFLTLQKNGGISKTDDAVGAIPTTDPLDGLLDFYNEWLGARQATNTDPVAAGLVDSPIFTPRMKEALQTALAEGGDMDPVLCQTVVPEKVGAKTIGQKDASVKMLVIARGEKLPGQAMVSLVPQNGMWAIDDIECIYGEQAPEMGEFSFEREGQLLHSVPPPLDSNYWYLVYESDGIMGYTAKLIFDEESVCTDTNGVTSTCDTNTFKETAPAFVQGEMGEAGLMVKHVELR